jgi:hypothetical protein
LAQVSPPMFILDMIWNSSFVLPSCWDSLVLHCPLGRADIVPLPLSERIVLLGSSTSTFSLRTLIQNFFFQTTKLISESSNVNLNICFGW